MDSFEILVIKVLRDLAILNWRNNHTYENPVNFVCSLEKWVVRGNEDSLKLTKIFMNGFEIQVVVSEDLGILNRKIPTPTKTRLILSAALRNEL